MVQVFDPTPVPSSASMIGASLGQGLSRNFQDPQQMVQRNLLRQSLEEARSKVNQQGSTPLDKAFAIMQAGAGISGSERYLGALLPLVMKTAEAEAAQKAPFGTNGQQVQQQQPQEANVEKDLQNFLQSTQQNQFYPSNVGDQQQPGNLPQAATTGIKSPVLSTQQLLQMSKPYAAQKTQAGIPTTPQEAYQELQALNSDNKEANTLVEQERKERVVSQREYGGIAEEKLSKLFPNSKISDEEVAYIKKQVEELAGLNASEADIERLASGEARIYKNMISKVENSLSAQRSYNKPIRNLMGASKSDVAARNDMRKKIEPLLKIGLYDKARSLLSDLGYYPEEREMIVSDLGENSQKIVSRLPKMTFPDQGTFDLTKKYDANQVKNFKQNLREVLQSDPSTNLILLRRKYDLEKGVGWRVFKDSLNEAMDEGIFKPNPDQFNQLNTLDEPSVGGLDKLLYGMGIIGR